MVLLDSVIEVEATFARATVRIGEDTVFFRPGVGVPALVGIEYMAQTVGLTAGFRAQSEGRKVGIGLLLGSRRFSSSVAAYPLGAELSISAREVWHDGQMAVFDCTIEEEKLLAQAQLNVFQPADPGAFLRGKGI
jgi:predicted hotdog family 3-hydroxylacyl-ACP dehydratase